MSRERPLRGGCSCGRNRYTVLIPNDANEIGQIVFDSSHAHRKSQATPLSAWLRVPLAWYHSSTYAFFDDETHSSIRRCYTAASDQNSKRHFCGFCGTPLTYWSESPPSEAEYISLTLGSLTGEDLRDLEELGLLPKEAFEDTENGREKTETVVPITERRMLNSSGTEGLPWFETLVQGSRLGKMSSGRGERTTGSSRYTVEWEIMEWSDGDGESPTTSKRKLGEVDEDGAAMEDVH